MGWLEDLIGPSPDDGSGFENWLPAASNWINNDTDILHPARLAEHNQAIDDMSMGEAAGYLQQGLHGIEENPYIKAANPLNYVNRAARALQVEAPSIADTIQPVVDNSPITLPKAGIDQIAGLGYDALGMQPGHPGNEAGQAYWEAAKAFDPTAGGLNEIAKATGYEPGLQQLGENVGGMISDPVMGLIPESKLIAGSFVPGMVDQVLGGVHEGGQKGFVDAAMGAGMLGLMGLSHLGGPEVNTESSHAQFDSSHELPVEAPNPKTQDNLSNKVNAPLTPMQERGILGNQEGMVRNPFYKDTPDQNIVFHGTPHDFTEFDLAHMGSGEGNQAYGPGFYHAEEPAIAGGYKDSLSGKNLQWDEAGLTAQNFVAQNKGDTEAAARQLQKLADMHKEMIDAPELKNDTESVNYNMKQYNKYTEAVKRVNEPPNKGNLLVSAIPPEDQFLNYDKPILDQPEIVKNAIPDVVNKVERYEPNLIKAVHDVEATAKGLKDFAVSNNLMPPNSSTLDKAIANFHSENQRITKPSDWRSKQENFLPELVDAYEKYNTQIENSNLPPQQKIEARTVLARLRNEYYGTGPNTKAARIILPSDSLEGQRNLQRLKEGGVKGVKYLDNQSRSVAEYGPRGLSPEDLAGNVMGKGKNKEKAIAELQRRMDRAPKPGELGYNADTNTAFKKRATEAIEHIKNDTYTGANLTHNYVVFDPKDIKVIGKSSEPKIPELSAHVKEMKAKYGEKKWRKSMTSAEIDKFVELTNEVQGIKPKPEPILPAENDPISSVVSKAAELTGMPGESFGGYLPEDAIQHGQRKGNNSEGQIYLSKDKFAKDQEGNLASIKTAAEANNKLDAIAHELAHRNAPGHGADFEAELKRVNGILDKNRGTLIQELMGRNTEIPPTVFPEELKPSISKPPTEAELKAQDLANQNSLYDELKNKPITPEEMASAKVPDLVQQIKKTLKEAKVEAPKGPPEKPPIEVKPPRTPKAPKPEPEYLQTVSKLERATLPGEEVIRRMNPNISAKEKAFRLQKETEGSAAYKVVEEAQRNINRQKLGKKTEERIARYLEGQTVILSPAEKAITDPINKLLHDNGVKERQIHAEFQRRGKYDLGGIKQVLFDTTAKAAEDIHLGDTKAKMLGDDRNARQSMKYYQDYIRQIKGRPAPEGAIGEITGKLRHASALGDLRLSALTQISQGVQTAGTMGIRRAIRAGIETFRHYEPNELKAMADGSLWPNIAHETARAMESSDYMHGVNTVDKAMRVHANVAARMLAKDALKGDKYAVRMIKDLGLDMKDPKFIDKAAKVLTDKTQFRTDAPHMPLWTKTVQGKLATQYLAFSYQHARYLTDLAKHPVKNFGQIMRIAAVGVGMGEVLGDTKASVNALIPGKGEDDKILRRVLDGIRGDPKFNTKPWLQKLQATTQNKRIPISSPGWRAVQNLANIGGAGIFQTILERTFDPKKNLAEKTVSALTGPVGTHALDFAESAAKDIYRYKKYHVKNPREIERFAIQHAPVKVPALNFYKLGNLVLPPKSYRSSGSNDESME